MKFNSTSNTSKGHGFAPRLFAPLVAGLMAWANLSVEAQTTFYVGGQGTIGTSTLTNTTGVATLPTSGGHWGAAGGAGIVYSSLTSPTLTVPTAGTVTLKFTHRYNFEADWDGGAVFVDVNGAGPMYLDGSAFSTNGYTAAVNSSAWIVSVFNGMSAGWDTTNLIQSVATLGPFNAGDTIAISFRGGWDEGFSEPDPNWEVGTVEVRDSANTALLNVDFLAGPSGFTVTSDPGLAGPWTYRGNLTCQFEVNPTTKAADRFAPSTPGGVIDLSGSRLEVVVSSGELAANSTFTLFDLSGGTVLQGNYVSLSVPPGLWDLSGLQPGGNGSITLLRPAPGTLINVNVDKTPRTGLVGPVASGAGVTWNQSAARTVSGLVDSFGAPTGVGYTCTLGNGPDDWSTSGEFVMLRQGFYNWTGTTPGNLVLNHLDPARKYDLYLASYYPNEHGSKGIFSTTNTTSGAATQNNDNGGGKSDGAAGINNLWVANTNYVLFPEVQPDASGNITITIQGVQDYPPGSYDLFTYRAMLNGFQLVDLTPITTPPPAPTNLTASVAFSQVTLNWAGVPTATSYKVKRSSGGAGYTEIATVTGTSFTDTSVLNGTTYSYVVSAINRVGESANSAPISVTPSLAAPTGLTAGAGDTLVRLSWTGALGASGYNVKRSLTSGGPYTTIANLSGTVYTNTGLVNDTTYYYVVSSTNSAGESANSLPAGATPVRPLNTTLGAWYFMNYVDPASLGWVVQRTTALTDTGIQLGTPGGQEGMMYIASPVGMTFSNAGIEMAFTGTEERGNGTPYTYLSLIADGGNPPRSCYGIGGDNTTGVGSLDQNINSGTGEQVTRIPLATNFVGYHTVALVRLDDNTLNAYCDGVFVGTRSSTPPLLALQRLGVGMNYFGPDHYFPLGGVVSRVRAFSFRSGGFNAAQLWTPAGIAAEKQITAFDFGSLGTGVVNEVTHTIAVTVPHISDLTGLIPNISFLGASMAPLSGVPQNFTSPVTYTVTAADGSTQAYVVTVSNPASTAKVMSNVFFPGLGYAYPAGGSGTNLVLVVTNGTPVTSLAPTYDVSPYATSSPASGTMLNFTTPQTYTVTAEDGSKVSYSVAVVPVMGNWGYQALVLATRPVAYWPLNEFDSPTAADLVGGLDAPYQGAYTLGAPGLRFGSRTAVYFGGGTAIAPVSESVNPSNFTLEFWARSDNTSVAYVASLQDRTTGSRIGYAIQKNNYTSGWDFTFGTGPTSYQTISSGTPVVAGSIYHVVATHDGANAKLYVNGALTASVAATYQPANPGAVAFSIGSRNGSSAFSGTMQDVAIYNRALTLQEIQTHTQNHPSSLQVTTAGGRVVLTWVPAGGGLQVAPVVTGPYTDVPAATSPWTNAPSAGNEFYRLKF